MKRKINVWVYLIALYISSVILLNSCRFNNYFSYKTCIEIANSRLKNPTNKPDPHGYIKAGFHTFRCEEYRGYEGVYDSHSGVSIKTFYRGSNWVCEYLIQPLRTGEKKYGDDTIRYIISHNFLNSFRIRKYNEFLWKGDSIMSLDPKSDTVKIALGDSLTFQFPGRQYAIYRFSGTLNNGHCGTFYLSTHFGVFKEYMPEEILSYQRYIGSVDQEFEIYWSHLYHLFQNPNFHVRCDNGPLFLLKSSYIKSDKPRCNCTEWPLK